MCNLVTETTIKVNLHMGIFVSGPIPLEEIIAQETVSTFNVLPFDFISKQRHDRLVLQKQTNLIKLNPSTKI